MFICLSWQFLAQYFLPFLAIFNAILCQLLQSLTSQFCHFWQLQGCTLQALYQWMSKLATFSSIISAIIGNFYHYLVPYCWTYWYCHFWQLQRCALQPKLAMFSSTISAIIGIFNTILSIIGTILDIPILPFLTTSEVHTAEQCLVQFLPLLAIIGNPWHTDITIFGNLSDIIIIHTGSIQMISKIDNLAFVQCFLPSLAKSIEPNPNPKPKPKNNCKTTDWLTLKDYHNWQVCISQIARIGHGNLTSAVFSR